MIERDEAEFEAEFRALYADIAPKLKAFLMKRGLSESDAWDCVQETMAAAF